MKKFVFYLLAVVLVASSCGKSEREFDEELNQAYSEMSKTLYISSIVHDEIISTWRKAILDEKTPSGKDCDDFDDALEELSDSLAKFGIVDSIRKWNNHLLLLTSEMNEAPNSRKECYDDFVNIVSDVSSFSRLATTGNMNDIKKSNDIIDGLAKKIDQFKIKYGRFLKDL